MRHISKLICILSAVTCSAHANVIGWDADGSNDNWNTGSNWSTDNVPNGFSDDADFTNGAYSAYINDSQNIKSVRLTAGQLSLNSGGTLATGGSTNTTTAGQVKVGQIGNSATLIIDGGSLTARGNNANGNLTADYGRLTIGNQSSSTGTANLISGSINTRTSVIGHTINSSDSTTGSFTHTGGSHTTLTLAIGVGSSDSTGSGNYTISGGSLNANGSAGGIYVSAQSGSSLETTGQLTIQGSTISLLSGTNYKQGTNGTTHWVADSSGITTLNISGDVELGGTIDVDLSLWNTAGLSEINLISNGNIDSITGNFSNMSDLFTSADGYQYQLSKTGGTPTVGVYNDLVLTLVPEPTSMALIVLGGTLLLRRRRRIYA